MWELEDRHRCRCSGNYKPRNETNVITIDTRRILISIPQSIFIQPVSRAGKVVEPYASFLLLSSFLQFLILCYAWISLYNYNYINHTLRARVRASSPYHQFPARPGSAACLHINNNNITPKTSCTRSVSISTLGALHKDRRYNYFPHPFHFTRLVLFVASGSDR